MRYLILPPQEINQELNLTVPDKVPIISDQLQGKVQNVDGLSIKTNYSLLETNHEDPFHPRDVFNPRGHFTILGTNTHPHQELYLQGSVQKK
jgi:hypothetical protein